MKRKTLKKVLITSASILLGLAFVLGIHIYLVTRPKAPDEHTIVMARVDFQQSLTSNDAQVITDWLYHQKGVDHVLLNVRSRIGIFTFKPIDANADNIIKQLQLKLHYKAVRFMPNLKDLESGCPVLAQNSISSKLYSFFNHK